MASVKLHKSTDEASRENKNNFGQKIAEMATWVFKTFTESRHEVRYTSVRKQAQWSSQNQADHTEQQQECHGSACTWRPAAGRTDTKKKEKEDNHAVFGAPEKAEHKKQEKNLMKKKRKKKSKDGTSNTSSSSSESEDGGGDERKN